MWRRRAAARLWAAGSSLLAEGCRSASLPSAPWPASWASASLGRSCATSSSSALPAAAALPARPRLPCWWAAEKAGAGPATAGAAGSSGQAADEAAVARLVQHSLGLRKQERTTNLQPDVLASRVRVLLAAGLTEADINGVITARGGGPHFARDGGEEGGQKTLALLRDLGLNSRQVAKCVHKQPTLLEAPHSTIAVAVAWFQGKARPGGRDPAAAAAKDAPGLLNYTVAALEANWDNLRQLLGVDEPEARKCLLTHPSALYLSAGNASSTVDTLEGLLGSREAAREALKRCMKLFDCGSQSLERNWGSLCTALGANEMAARRAVLQCPSVLAIDASQPKFQRRLLFLERNFGLSGEAAFNSYLTYSLLLASPRLAWARECSPPGTVFDKVRPFVRPDGECMKLCGVPLEGFAEFRRRWLASEEGRFWCEFEKKA